jgi:hypothetical protein
MAETLTTLAGDLPDTVFDDMTDEQIVETLRGIEQEANVVFMSGDQATSSQASKLGVMAHAIRHLIEDAAAPAAASHRYRGADADAAGEGKGHHKPDDDKADDKAAGGKAADPKK